MPGLGGLLSVGMVEAAGIEPASEKHSPEASTCVAPSKNFAGAPQERAAARNRLDPWKIRIRHGPYPDPSIHFSVAPEGAVNQGLPPERHGDLGRECEVVVGDYFNPLLRVESLGTQPKACLVPRRIQCAPIEGHPVSGVLVLSRCQRPGKEPTASCATGRPTGEFQSDQPGRASASAPGSVSVSAASSGASARAATSSRNSSAPSLRSCETMRNQAESPSRAPTGARPSRRG